MTDYLGPLSNTLRRLSGPGHHDHGFGWRAEEVERDLIAHGFEITVKPADPIVWDGTDEAFETIGRALPKPLQFAYDEDDHRHAEIIQRVGFGFCVRGAVPHMCRVQIVGDTFVILPPEETP